MSKRFPMFWICQLVGWSFYASTLVFARLTIGQGGGITTPTKSFERILNTRVFIGVLLGILFTNIMRELIHILKLKPPVKKENIVKIVVLLMGISLAYSLSYSSISEYFHLYINLKNTFQQRVIFNFLYDVPIIIVWLSFYYVWHYVQLYTNTELDKLKLENLVKDLQLKTIKSQVNPHFIFNALNSIRALVDENPKMARKAITELSNILRSSLRSDKLEHAPLKDELNIVRDYLALEQIRFEERLNVSYQIEDSTLDLSLPPMMLQTLVENAIKHGINKRLKGGKIHIKSKKEIDHLELIIQNTGNLSENHSFSQGFGVQSTKNRLQLLYGSESTFQLTQREHDWVEAKITIPLN